MKTLRLSCLLGYGAIFIGGLVASQPLAAQTYTSLPVGAGNTVLSPYHFTGILTATSSSSSFRSFGSGAVVKNPRVVYSCAHVVFDTDAVNPWLNEVRWYRAWASSNQPSTSGGQRLRSYQYHAGYASAALRSQNSSQSFSQDFVVHYAYEDTANGGYANSYEDGVSQLKSSRTKLITGYPIGNYASSDSRKYLMHSTGPFVRSFAVSTGDYLVTNEVSTGSGNSGGPVWVSDGSQYAFAGVLISGLERSQGDSTDLAGVYGVDSSSAALINAAIGDAGFVLAPTITTQPTSRRVNAGQSASFTVVAAGTGLGYRWLFGGAAISEAASATLTLNNVSVAQAGSYQVIVSNTSGEAASITVTLSVDAAPTIVRQPASQTIVIGNTAILSVSAQSSTSATYQWRKDGLAISGATDATLTLSNVQSTAEGSYTVVITNAPGSVTSSAAVLTVNPPLAIVTQPRSQTLTNGSNLVLTVGATGGAGPHSYQWRFDGAVLSNAVGSTYTASNLGLGSTGTFDVVVRDGLGAVTSAPALITVIPVSRISNLSILTRIDATDSLFTVGTVVGGTGTSGSKALLIRAAGPALTQLGIGGTLPDPKLDLFSAQTVVGTNNDWGGTAALGATFAEVGAFAYASAGSKDAAITNSTLASGSYSVQVSGIGGATGVVIAELYDATPASAFTAATPRLINVSVLKQINRGETLTAGFVIAGATSKQVLIRAVGPTLGSAPFNVPGVMADPKLDLFRGQTVINSNSDWGGGTPLTAAFANVGAFALGAASKDAALHVTLQPGNYTVEVGEIGGAGGLVLVEIYEVP